MSRVGVGVIGVGGWGKHHVRVYKDLEYEGLCKLVAVSDKNPEAARRIASTWQVEECIDNQRLLSREDVQAVSICTPTTTHYDVALQAMDAGKHLLVEKPLADTAQKALGIARTAKRKDLKLAVGFVERYNQGLVRLKQVIDRGRIGEVRLATAQRISLWSPRVDDAGVILDSAIHDIDAIRYVFGEDPSSIYAESLERPSQGPETGAIIDLTFESGIVAHIMARRLTRGGEQRKIRQLQMVGSKGTAILFYIPQIVLTVEAPEILSPFVSTRGKPRYTKNPMKCVSVHSPPVWKEPLKEELADFLKSISESRESSVTALDGVRALQVVEAGLESIEKSTPVSVSYENL